MAYIIIEDFRAGLDRRKLAVASPQGSLQTCENAHITRGGEIEKRLAMVAKYSLSPGQTFGFAGANGVLYTFGSVASPAVPSGVTYQQLVHPSSHAMDGIVFAEFYDGKVFVAAHYTNGDTLHFYDGTRITDWDGGSGATVAGQAAVAGITLKDKFYAAYLSVLGFSAIGDPTLWQTGTGYGFKNMANQSAGSEALTALGRYGSLMAVFARRNTQIWYLDPDPTLNVQQQVLPNIGTFAARSVVSFGERDVFFLSDTGARSLRTQQSGLQAGVSDVGTPIDDDLLTYMSTLTEAQRFAAAAEIDPINGRYVLAIGNRAYVFSYFASSKISAWSTYEFGFQVTDWVSMDGRLWGRAGDTIYQLGGDDGATYDSTVVEIDLPYIDGRAIATFKNFTAIDIVSQGEWDVYINTDPNQPTEESKIAVINNITLSGPSLGMLGHSPVCKLRFVSRGTGPAKLSKIIVHYDAAEAT